MLSLAVVRAAGELDVVVRLLLLKHHDLRKRNKKSIHTYLKTKQRLSGGQGGRLRVGAVNAAHWPKKKIFLCLNLAANGEFHG